LRQFAGIPIVLLLAACSQLPVKNTAAAADAEKLNAARRAAIQGDMVSALQGLRELSPNFLSAKDAAMRECMLQRHAASAEYPPASNLPPAAAAVLNAYQDYWRSLLLKQAEQPQAEKQLLTTLNTILAENGQTTHDRSDLDATTDAIKPLIERQGLHALTGKTSPYYELMLWRKEAPKRFSVALPEQVTAVDVVFMDDFMVQGWLGYETCNYIGTGGWAEKDKLYAVSEKYDQNSERFKISYLAHEGQHFSDYAHYPKLEQPELEYRAKLTELAMSITTTRSLFLKFLLGGVRGRNAPHPHAEYMLGQHMSARLLGTATPIETDPAHWETIGDQAIRDAARSLLLESSATLKAAGASTATRFLPD